MKLEKILDQLNSFEKNAFLKILTGIKDSSPSRSKDIDTFLSNEKDLKNADNINIVRVFHLIEPEFTKFIRNELADATSQLDLLIDILIRDGNNIMTREWFHALYEKEVKSIKGKLKEFKKGLEDEKSDIPARRKRDYKIYKDALHMAYHNDELKNRECKVSDDEQLILIAVAKGLGLSQEEVKLINYLIIELKLLNIDSLIDELKNIGLIFYTKKTLKIYIADEIVRVLRKVRGKEVADKYFRRVLKQLREPQINMICKNHHVDWKVSLDVKIKSIIKEGINFRDVLIDDIFKEDTTLTEKKNFINEFVEKNLMISHLKGATIEEKVDNLVEYFEQIDKEDKVGISIDGYEKMLADLSENIPSIKKLVLETFELQEDDILKNSILLDYNIKPRDILDLIPEQELKDFCEKMKIKSRGNIILNILEKYKDAENLYIENYSNIAYRKYNELKDNGLNLKEADLGIKFEEITKNIFTKLAFNVDEKLRKEINTAKDKIDIILNLGEEGLIIVECKTLKESGYNKFGSVSRQIKSYISLAQKKGYRVIKTLLIAPEFSEDFEKDCREEIEMNLSLITADTLVAILNGFRETKHKTFPYQLLMKDVLIQEDWILKAINK